MNAVVKREAQVADAMQLESIKNQLSGLLNGNQQKMEAFKSRMLKMAVSDGLKGCTPESLIACGMQALTLNLPLEAGQGYVVKYKNVAQLDVGYKGWQVLAKRSGFSVLADAVYSCDFFEQRGFGFDVQFNFEHNHSERNTADDKWVKANIKGVVVSVRDDATGQVVHRYVEHDMLLKIVGMSPSQASTHSPHNKWAEQMLCAKAIKQVISKMPIDLSRASELAEAIGIVNRTESTAQTEVSGPQPYSAERFDENWPKWVKLVESGQKKALTIITLLSNGHSLTQEQMQKVMTLTQYEPIDGESSEVAGEEPDTGTQDNMREAS